MDLSARFNPKKLSAEEKAVKKAKIAQELATMRQKQDSIAKATLKEAIDATVCYGYSDEKKHWFEYQDECEIIDRASFVSALKEHQLYKLIVLKVYGYEREINREVDELWDEWKERVGTPSSDESSDESVEAVDEV